MSLKICPLFPGGSDGKKNQPAVQETLNQYRKSHITCGIRSFKTS